MKTTGKQKPALTRYAELCDWMKENQLRKKEDDLKLRAFYTHLAYTEIDFGTCGNLNEAGNPFYELEWSRSMFADAARLHIGIQYLTWAKMNFDSEGCFPPKSAIQKQLQTDLLRNAARDNNCPMQNAYRVELANLVKWYFDA